MESLTFTREEFARALQSLLPTGRVWPRDPDAAQSKTCDGLTRVYVRQTNRSAHLLVDAFPATTRELLPEWESTLGLPDPCSGLAATILARQQQVLAKFIGLGIANKQKIIDYLALLGYTVTISQFMPWNIGMPIGYPMYGPEWAHVWQINAPLDTVTFFNVTSGVNEPLSSFGNAVLECIALELAQAHTIVIFSYS